MWAIFMYLCYFLIYREIDRYMLCTFLRNLIIYMLGTTQPGFRSCNPPWLTLSEGPWDPKPLRRQSLSPWQGCRLCPLYLPCLAPGLTSYPMTGKIAHGRDDLRQAPSWRGPQGRTWGAMEKEGNGPSPLGFDRAWVLILSARNLLIS